MVLGVDQLRRDSEVLDPAESLRLKIAFGNEICTIASGPNAIANLLDLTILVSVSRRSFEELWQPHTFGESARPLLESCRQAETDLRQLAGRMLKPEQQAESRQAIEVWFQQNPCRQAGQCVQPPELIHRFLTAKMTVTSSKSVIR